MVKLAIIHSQAWQIIQVTFIMEVVGIYGGEEP